MIRGILRTWGQWWRTQILQIWALPVLRAMFTMCWGSILEMCHALRNGVQKAGDALLNGSGTMIGDTWSDSHSLEKGPAVAVFAKPLCASVHPLVLNFVITQCFSCPGLGGTCSILPSLLQHPPLVYTESLNGLVWKGPWSSSHSNPLPCKGTSSTRPGFSKPSPTFPGTLPGMGHLQLPWATCASASTPWE